MSPTPFRQRLALQVLSKRNLLRATGTQGFTLIELLVVIVILGVLGAVGYQAYVNQIARAFGNTAANTATALAKNCAALGVTGDSGDFDTLTGASVDTNQVSLTASTCNPAGETSLFTVQVGNDEITRTTSASVTAEGQVTPAPVPTAND